MHSVGYSTSIQRHARPIRGTDCGLVLLLLNSKQAAVLGANRPPAHMSTIGNRRVSRRLDRFPRRQNAAPRGRTMSAQDVNRIEAVPMACRPDDCCPQLLGKVRNPL